MFVTLEGEVVVAARIGNKRSIHHVVSCYTRKLFHESVVPYLYSGLNNPAAKLAPNDMLLSLLVSLMYEIQLCRSICFICTIE